MRPRPHPVDQSRPRPRSIDRRRASAVIVATLVLALTSCSHGATTAGRATRGESATTDPTRAASRAVTDGPPPTPLPGSTSTTAAGGVTGALTATDQRGTGSVTVASVTIRGASGWLVLHLDQDGTPGAVGGKVHVNEGTTKNVVIPVEQPSSNGVYWPMLHVDAGVQGTYEFPGADLPVAVNDNLVMARITLAPS